MGVRDGFIARGFITGLIASLSMQVVSSGSDTIPHQILHRQTPLYPLEALRAGIEGSCDVSFDILPNGHTADIKITSCSAPGVFEKYVVDAVSQYRYQPALKNGIAVAVPDTKQRINFQVDRSSRDDSRVQFGSGAPPKSGMTVLLTPHNQIASPSVLPPSHTGLSPALERELKRRDLNVEIISVEEFLAIAKEAHRNVGGMFDPMTGQPSPIKQMQIEKAIVTELVARHPAAAVIAPSIEAAEIALAKGQTTWDGITRKSPIFTTANESVRARWPGLSVLLNVFDSSGSIVFVSRSGLALFPARKSPRETRGLPEPSVTLPHLMPGQAELDETARIALAPLDGPDHIERQQTSQSQ